MAINLSKGQTISLEKKDGSGGLTQVTMGLGWDMRQKKGLFSKLFGGGQESIDLDASAVLFDGKKNPVDTVWFRQLRSQDGSLQHTGDNLTGEGDGDDEQIKVDLTRVPAGVTDIVFVVSSFRGDTFDQIDNAFCRLVDDAKDEEIARYTLTGGGNYTAMVMARLKRSGSGWTMTAVGNTTQGRTINDMMPVIKACVE